MKTSWVAHWTPERSTPQLLHYVRVPAPRSQKSYEVEVTFLTVYNSKRYLNYLVSNQAKMLKIYQTVWSVTLAWWDNQPRDPLYYIKHCQIFRPRPAPLNNNRGSPTSTVSNTMVSTSTNFSAIGIKFVLVEFLFSKIHTIGNWLCSSH